MKAFFGIAFVALAISAATAEVASSEEPTVYNYHKKIGIPEANRIRKLEEEAINSGNAEGRIVGGSISDISQTPWQAGLVIRILFIFNSVCGASLISNTRLVTAAHCYHDGSVTAQSFTVVLGSNTLFSGGVRINTNNIAVHPNWNPRNANSDIAVLRISSVSFTNVIQPIALPSGNELSNNFVNQIGLASGYGLTSDQGSISNNQRLSSVNLRIVADQECANLYGNWYHNSNICTSGAGGQSVCQGDSGGPLAVMSGGRRVLVSVAGDRLNSYHCSSYCSPQTVMYSDLKGTIASEITGVGATSFGHRDGCSVGHPAAYARITSFVSWINNQ